MNYPDHKFIIAGDFNELNDDDIKETTDLIQIVNEPTRQSSYLDRIYLSELYPYKTIVIKSAAKSDHKAVLVLEIKDIKRQEPKKSTVHYVRIRNAKQIARMKEEMADKQIEFQTNHPNFQEACDNLHNKLKEIMDKYTPLRRITITSREPESVTPYIKRLLRRRNKLMRAGKISEADNIAEKVRIQIIKNNTESLKSQDYRKSSKAMWEKINEVRKKKRSDRDECKITAQYLNEHYTTISTDPLYQQPTRMEGPYNNSESFETWEIYRSLTKLKKTATGPDKIPAWFFKLTSEFTAVPIKDMLNQSIYRGTVPNQWKTAIITPIPKIAKAVEAADFRPISVTSVLSRMCEKMIAKNS